MWLLSKKFITNAMTGIVSPHGMTDYIHAKKFGFLPELYKINLSIISSGYFFNVLHMQPLIHLFFLVSSAVHFRNDMPTIRIKTIHPKLLQLVFSSAFVGSLHFIPFEYFIIYMLCVHTPNHYFMAWNYIKDNLEETVGLVIGLGFLLSQINYVENIPSDFLTFLQTLVISHIVYQEIYVFPEYKEIVERYKKI